MLITDVVSIYHSSRTGNTKNYDVSPAYQFVNACISPTGTDMQTADGGVAAYQLFEIFIQDTTIQIKTGDKIKTPDTEYLVDGQPYVVNNRYLQYIRVLAREVF